MGFISNRDDIKGPITQGGWAPPTGAVAFGGEIQVADIAEGLVDGVISIYAENPAPFLAWLEQLMSKALIQMEQAIISSFTPVVRQQAVSFASNIIKQLLQGRTSGEQFINLLDFRFKTGVAQFSGQNTQWLPDFSGGHEQAWGPFIPSWCPYVGFRAVPHNNPPPSHPVVRTMWVGSPSLIKHEGTIWIEYQNNNVIARFTQESEDQNFIYLYDQSRNLHLALGNGSGYWRQGNSGSWNYFRAGGWGQVA